MKVVETPSPGTSNTTLQKALAISMLGNNPMLAEGPNTQDFFILDCLSSTYCYEQKCNDLTELLLLLAAGVLHCRFSQRKEESKASPIQSGTFVFNHTEHFGSFSMLVLGIYLGQILNSFVWFIWFSKILDKIVQLKKY